MTTLGHKVVPSTPPTRRDYDQAESLLRDVMANSHGSQYFEAAGLLVWIEDTKPRRVERADRVLAWLSSPLTEKRPADLSTLIIICCALAAAVLTAWQVSR